MIKWNKNNRTEIVIYIWWKFDGSEINSAFIYKYNIIL